MINGPNETEISHGRVSWQGWLRSRNQGRWLRAGRGISDTDYSLAEIYNNNETTQHAPEP